MYIICYSLCLEGKRGMYLFECASAISVGIQKKWLTLVAFEMGSWIAGSRDGKVTFHCISFCTL